MLFFNKLYLIWKTLNVLSIVRKILCFIIANDAETIVKIDRKTDKSFVLRDEILLIEQNVFEMWWFRGKIMSCPTGNLRAYTCWLTFSKQSKYYNKHKPLCLLTLFTKTREIIVLYQENCDRLSTCLFVIYVFEWRLDTNLACLMLK